MILVKHLKQPSPKSFIQKLMRAPNEVHDETQHPKPIKTHSGNLLDFPLLFLLEKSVKSFGLHPVFGPLFTPYPPL